MQWVDVKQMLGDNKDVKNYQEDTKGHQATSRKCQMMSNNNEKTSKDVM